MSLPEPAPSSRPSPRQPAPRSLADQLRACTDAELVALLQDRPDLAVPPPADLTSLAARAATRAGVQRALDGLDAPTLQVVEVLAVLPEPASPAEVSRRWGAPAGPVLQRLRELALVWGSARALRLVRTVRDVLGPHPAGLGPSLSDALGRRSPQRLADLLEDLGLPAAGDVEVALARLAEHLGRAEVLDTLLAGAPDGVRAVLDRLTWGPPVGQLTQADRPVRSATATGPVEWLLAHGLLAVSDPGHVVLPREVGLALRGGRVHAAPALQPPPLAGRSRPASTVTGTAAGAAAEAVRLVAALGELWGAAPPPVLRSGGLGVRELRRAAVALESDEPTVALAVEVGHAAGLIADDGEADPRWAPTPAFDAWSAASVGQRWAELGQAWLATSRCPRLVGTRDARDAPRVALGPELDRSAAPGVRRWALTALAEARGADAGEGEARASEPRQNEARANEHRDALLAGPGDRGDLVSVPAEALRARLDWLLPRRGGPARDALLDWALEEAAWLGVTGAGALSPHGRALLAGQDPAGLLEAVLPEPVDHVLLQADLTAIAPGPLVPEVARELGLVADIESRGGATVYRFSPASVRRALDAGRSAADLLATLQASSQTGVPQPLQYLITDTARRHGRIRVGAALSYLRADDEAALAELLADRRAERLRLRRLAATVLVSPSPPEQVLEVLRGMGLAPAAETADGGLLLGEPPRHRTPPRARPRPIDRTPPHPGPVALAATVAALRAADRDGRNNRNGLDTRDSRAGREGSGGSEASPGRFGSGSSGGWHENVQMDPVNVLALVREAASGRQPLWIGYADAGGRSFRRLVDPLHVEAGRIVAFDREAEQVRTFSVHRVFGVAPA